jgi:hypothetical protein
MKNVVFWDIKTLFYLTGYILGDNYEECRLLECYALGLL